MSERTVDRIVAHAYPWDVLGDPHFVDRARALGVAEISLAASYHSTRAATPLHPAHKVVDAHHAALYRPIRTAAWDGHTVTARVATWAGSEDAFADAARILIDAGIEVNAWIVLSHSTVLGHAHPGATVVNCFGDRYPYALAPGHPDIVRYARTLAAEAVHGVALHGVSIEACGQLGIAHVGPHEKTDGAYPGIGDTLMSISCTERERALWADRGVDPDKLTAKLRAGVDALTTGTLAPDAAITDVLDEAEAEAVLSVRHAQADALRGAVLGAVRAEIPSARVTLHGHPNPWKTGPSPALTSAAAEDVDAVLVSAWPGTAETVAVTTQTRALVGDAVDVGAYVSVLPPKNLDDVSGHVAATVAAGANELHLYHLGLVNAVQLAALGRIIRDFSV
ncbi:hypothetical protein CJ179_08720 [Rhodococcus sp. ACS1]|uniref:hypothetical protein n=1 Tax=Rhodococcus TaxID=1827 RepID=UPI000BB141F9|nr:MULTISPECIES: hypothetical protein [Rhodococcus]PBC50863.1 hypothetical protein CJ179_08720 [Rhodococcus sp. ACS1]QSE83296.1 hypothetical protein JWS14_31165 [Rhodococcus koreensis]